MIYTFQNKETLEITEHTMKLAELEPFKLANPHLERYIGNTTPIGDPVRLGIRKNDGAWREMLQLIAHRTPGGKGLNDSIR